MSPPAQSQSTRLVHFTPLRYPGGKSKLAPFVKRLLQTNHLLDGHYVEPYAGGAGVAMELLLHEFCSHIHINDINRAIFSFWKSVVDDTEDLCRLIHNSRVTMKTRDKQKAILMRPGDHDDLALGFALFFLNRTNRSGILNGGVIGGRSQTGPWKMDARYNAKDLVRRIAAIARVRDRITVTRLDALKYLQQGCERWPPNTLIYCDPPYYMKGRDLYYDYYEEADHELVANFLINHVARQKWMVSYDNVRAVRELYRSCTRLSYRIGYSARENRVGSEVMFFCETLKLPQSFESINGLKLFGAAS